MDPSFEPDIVTEARFRVQVAFACDLIQKSAGSAGGHRLPLEVPRARTPYYPKYHNIAFFFQIVAIHYALFATPPYLEYI